MRLSWNNFICCRCKAASFKKYFNNLKLKWWVCLLYFKMLSSVSKKNSWKKLNCKQDNYLFFESQCQSRFINFHQCHVTRHLILFPISLHYPFSIQPCAFPKLLKATACSSSLSSSHVVPSDVSMPVCLLTALLVTYLVIYQSSDRVCASSTFYEVSWARQGVGPNLL